jgi:hypothetical protein
VKARFGSIAALFAVAVTGGCSTTSIMPTTNVGQAARETIAVSVGPCFGFCPVYSLALSSDGTVVFDGARHTAVLGERRTRVGEAVYRAVAADLARYRAPAGGERVIDCTMTVSDQAGFVMTWTDARGRLAKTRYPGGCREGDGQAFEVLIRGLPLRLGIADWAQQKTYPGATRG